MSTYELADNSGYATHYLWRGKVIQSVWTKKTGRNRIDLEPTDFDNDLSIKWEGHVSKCIRPIRLFDNSRINTKESLTLSDILSGRAQKNLDVIIEKINAEEGELRNALLSCLTSSIGHMSKMVFAITGRGKTSGKVSTKIEVGSWVIGYWRPDLHFEINAWNCFERRVQKLVKAIRDQESVLDLDYAVKRKSAPVQSRLDVGDARRILNECATNSISLIITDPPHGDRIPYLELSELWNAVLNFKSSFEDEIVISNAKTRNKGSKDYQCGISQVFEECLRVLKPGGYMVVLFNARDDASWVPIKKSLDQSQGKGLDYVGAFEAHYSTGSVVQDNRDGGLQHDFGLVFTKGIGADSESRLKTLSALPGWTRNWPSQNTSRLRTAVGMV